MSQASKVEMIVIAEGDRLSLQELCETCQIEIEFIIELIEEGLLHPEGTEQSSWQFSARDLKRSQKALRLQQDLEINMPGIALVIDLMEEIESLREKEAYWQKLYGPQ